MINRPVRLAVIILILLVLSLSIASAEARTFRKAVQRDTGYETRDSGYETRDNTISYKPSAEIQKPNADTNCEATVKRVRGKRVVSSDCVPQSFLHESQARNTQIVTIEKPLPNEALIVLNVDNTKETEKIVRFIKDNGNPVSIVFSQNLVLSPNLEPQVESKLKSRFGFEISAVYRNKITDNVLQNKEIDQTVLNYWNSKFDPKKTEIPVANIQPIYNDMFIPLDKNGEPPQLSGIPSDIHTSEYMFGNVQVSIILPESNGQIDPNAEDWTTTQEDQVLSEIADALNWWVARKSTITPTDLTFWNETHLRVPTRYEPISRPSGDLISDEFLWINEIMDQFGVPNAIFHTDRVRMYDDRIRDNNARDWGFTIFVVNSDNDPDGMFTNGRFAYAYLQGPFLVMTYDNENYSIANMDAVTAHEMGHIFGALDQYTIAQTSCTARSGFLQVENQNYDGTTPCLSDVSSIMRGQVPPYTSKVVDTYARGQIGWRDLDNDKIIDTIDSTYNTFDVDSDGDGIINYWDLCPSTAGIPPRGCPPDNPPTVSVVANPNPVGTGQTVTYTANANDDNSVYKIEIVVDGALKNLCYPNQPAPTASCSYATSYPATGTHNFYANAIDDSNQGTGTSILTLQVVDASMPSVSISASPNPVGVGQTVTFTVSASDDTKITYIRLLVDGGIFRQCPINAQSGSCSDQNSFGSTGTHTYKGWAIDSSGNEVFTPEYTLTVVQDPVPGPAPRVRISVDKSPVYVGEPVTFTVTATDDVQINTIWVKTANGGNDGNSGAVIQNTCYPNKPSDSCSYTTTFLVAKNADFRGEAVDNSNLWGSDPTGGAVYTLTITNRPPPPSPPTVSVSATPAPVEVGQTVTITANANDNAQVSNIKLYLDGVEVNSCTINSGSGSCPYSTSYLSIGTHTFYATATDNEGSVGRDPASGTNGFNVVDTTAPAISAFANPNPVNAGVPITLNATVSDNLKVAWAAIYVDGQLARNCTISAQSGWCPSIKNYASTGTHTFYAITADSSGNRQQTALQNFAVVDNTAPIFLQDLTINTASGMATIIAVAQDNAQLSQIKIFVDGALAKTCTINMVSGTCEYSNSWPPSTAHRTYAIAADASGNAVRIPQVKGEKYFTVGGIQPPNSQS